MSQAGAELSEIGKSERRSVDGVELAFSRTGSGPPLICLHAIGHDAEDFSEFARRCAGYQLIAIDWPGHGQSGPDRRPPSAARYAELLIGLLDQLGVDNPTLLGNSIGGAAAILYARARPVRALVLCDSGGLFAIDRSVRLACALFAAFFARGARGARWFSWAYARYYRYLVLPSAAARVRREQIIARGPALSPLLRDAWLSFAQPEADLRGSLASLTVPVWFAWAKRDRVIPFARVRPSVARCPNAQVSLFNGGHAPFLECPDAFAQGFLGFMRGEGASL